MAMLTPESDILSASSTAMEDAWAPAAPRSVVLTVVRRWNGAAGTAVLGLLIAVAVIGPFVFRFNPAAQQLNQTLLPPSLAHPLGTDNYGRDEVLLLIYAARYTIGVGIFSVFVGLVIGVPLGIVAGYVGGWVDAPVQALTDIMLAFPGIVLALALVAGLGVGLRNVVIAVGISSAPGFIRLARSEALRLREMPFVEAARALGVSHPRVVLRYVLPNGLTPIIVQATLQFGTAILTAAGLGFFGLGVQPPTPEWGSLLGAGREYMFSSPQVALYPGLCIFITVLAGNLLGDGLRDALDPRFRG